MAEGSATSSNIGRTFQKTVNRTKEKMMQTIGRNDKTSDLEFDTLAATFNEQQAVATKLLTEYKNYVKQVKALQSASETMQQAVRAAYESHWPDSQSYIDISDRLTTNWLTYTNQLEEAQTHIAAYVERFNEIKQKIAKRGRKVTDYDSARHNAMSLESAKRRDSFKVTKAQTEMVLARQVYEGLNVELQFKLKELYESRTSSICLYLSTMYETEANFLRDAAEMKQQLAQAAKRAAATGPAMSSTTSYTKQTSATSSGGASCPDSPIHYSQSNTDQRYSNDYEMVGSNEYKRPTDSKVVMAINSTSPVTSPTSLTSPLSRDDSKNSSSSSSLIDDGNVLVNGNEALYSSPMKNKSGNKPETDDVVAVTPPLLVFDEDHSNGNRNGSNHVTADKRVKYQVAAIFDYEAGDEDELSFKIGELINVIDFESPDDVDEGWLMGIKVSTGEKGIVPENFTRKI